MSEFHAIEGATGEEKVQILFFHGLNGNEISTWSCSGDDPVFWPIWLLQDVEGARGATISYDASASKWRSASMSLTDRATNIAALLISQPAMVKQPLVLIGHSFGGLIIKSVMRYLTDQAPNDPRYQNILSNIKLVIFMGTPHSGSWLSAAANMPIVKSFFRPTGMTDSLRPDSPELRNLDHWYRTNVPAEIEHVVFTEARKKGGVLSVVSPSSADPGIPRVTPIPVDADHSSICKPKDRQSLVYATVLEAVRQVAIKTLPTILRDPDSGHATIPLTLSAPTARRPRGLSSRLDAHKEALVTAAEDRPFTILLCGPTELQSGTTGAAELSQRLYDALKLDGFDVVVGGEQGISNARLGSEVNTLGRELAFLESHCNAVIIIAAGASSWTEVGVFSRHLYSDKKVRERKIDIVVLADPKELGAEMFTRSGAIAYVEGAGRADMIEHDNYDIANIVTRMRSRRSVYIMDKRGRPRKIVA